MQHNALIFHEATYYRATSITIIYPVILQHTLFYATLLSTVIPYIKMPVKNEKFRTSDVAF